MTFTAGNVIMQFGTFALKYRTIWKSVATATSDTLRSATARTARYQGLTGINIKGGTVRLKVLIQTIADSMFIANPWAYYTMK